MLMKNNVFTRRRFSLSHFRPLALLCVCLSVIAVSQPALAKEKLRVVTTFTIIQDIAQNVAGDAAVVESITKPGRKSTTISPRHAISLRHSTPI